MRKQTFSDKQREAQQRKKQAELWEKTHPKAEVDKAEEPAKKSDETKKPGRRAA
ncbi:hypothetical protein D3C83_257360 [compost metagenome]